MLQYCLYAISETSKFHQRKDEYITSKTLWYAHGLFILFLKYRVGQNHFRGVSTDWFTFVTVSHELCVFMIWVFFAYFASLYVNFTCNF